MSSMKFILTVSTYVLCTVGLIQAVIVLCLYIIKSQCVVKRRPQFSIGLMVADALLAATSVTQKLVFTLTDTTKPSLHILSAVLFFSCDTFLATGQWLQLAFVVDRFTAVRFPMQHRSWLPKHRIKYALIGICSTCAILGVTGMILVGRQAAIMDRKSFFIANLIMVIAEVTPGLPSLILFLWIQKLVCHARFKSRKLTQTQSSQSLASRVLESRKNLLLSAMMSFLTTCGWPAFRLGFIICMNKCSPKIKVAGQCLLLFGYVSMLLDPWVYALIPHICMKKIYYFCRGRSYSERMDRNISMNSRSLKGSKSDINTIVTHT